MSQDRNFRPYYGRSKSYLSPIRNFGAFACTFRFLRQPTHLAFFCAAPALSAPEVACLPLTAAPFRQLP